MDRFRRGLAGWLEGVATGRMSSVELRIEVPVTPLLVQTVDRVAAVLTGPRFPFCQRSW